MNSKKLPFVHSGSNQSSLGFSNRVPFAPTGISKKIPYAPPSLFKNYSKSPAWWTNIVDPESIKQDYK